MLLMLNGPLSKLHVSNMLVKEERADAVEDALEAVELGTKFNMVFVMAYTSAPNRKRCMKEMLLMVVSSLWLRTNSVKMHVRNWLLLAMTMSSSSNTKERK